MSKRQERQERQAKHAAEQAEQSALNMAPPGPGEQRIILSPDEAQSAAKALLAPLSPDALAQLRAELRAEIQAEMSAAGSAICKAPKVAPQAPARIGWSFPFNGSMGAAPKAPKGRKAAGAAQPARAGYSRLPWEGALPIGARCEYLGGARAPWLPEGSIGRIIGYEQTAKPSRRYEIVFFGKGSESPLLAAKRTNLAEAALRPILAQSAAA